MRKLLAIVQPNGSGFRGYVPRLPGCEASGATKEEASANITTAVRKYLSGTSTEWGKPEEVEVIVAVEAPPSPRPREDGLDEFYDRARRESKLEDLEFFLHLDDQQWLSFEEFMHELGLDAAEQAPGEAPE